MSRLERYLRDPLLALGVAAIGGGFVAIGLGWLGSARQACVDCQIPYLISGGAAGLGLVVVGAALLVVRGLHGQQERLEATFRALREEVALGQADNGAGTNGHIVTVGRSSYHLPNCRLVRERREVETVPLEVAQERELSPCRICEPPA